MSEKSGPDPTDPPAVIFGDALEKPWVIVMFSDTCRHIKRRETFTSGFRGGDGGNVSLLTRPWVDVNQQIEVPEKHHKSSGLLASLIVTLFTVWVYIIVVLTSLCPVTPESSGYHHYGLSKPTC
jgi:hypothetical protein